MLKRWRARRPEVPQGLVDRLTRPPVVIGYAGFASFVVTEVVDSGERLTTAGFFGFWATVWALILAILIYIINAGEQRELRGQIEALQGPLEEMVNATLTKQTAEELAAAKVEHREYLDALREAIPGIPESDFVTVERLPGRGNQPVIVETKMRRYSIWRGGRNGGFHVSKLANPETT